MLRRILLVGLIAGSIAGLVAAAVQQAKIVPLIAAAEQHEHPAAGHQHGGAPAWEPAPGIERNAYTVLADLVAGIGFALLLSGAVSLAQQRGYAIDLARGLMWGAAGFAAFARHRGYAIDPARGLMWGAAGFAAFALAPSVGLPPELPGMAAAELAARQQWWLFAAAATALGLTMLAFSRHVGWRLLGIAAIIAPHLLGAPAAPDLPETVPAGLAADFVSASLAAAALFWMVLGGLTGWLYRRFDPV